MWIRNVYGNDGYAVWFMLLEELGKANDHYINLNDKTQLLYLSAEMKVSQEVFLGIINTLVDMDEFDKDLWEFGKVIYSKKFVESIQDAYIRRKNKMLQYSEICIHFLKNCKQYHEKLRKNLDSASKIPQSKVKESKVDKTKDIDYVKLVEYFNKITGKKTKVVPDKVKDQFSSRIKEGFSKEDIMDAIKNCFNDPYHIETNHKHLTLEFISRSAKLEKYSSVKKEDTTPAVAPINKISYKSW